MSLFRKLVGVFQAAGLSIRKRLLGGGPPVYVEDVFSTYLYTGNDSTQTITNNIDLSTKGGMVWIKSRSGAFSHNILDTVRGFNYSGTQTRRLDPSTTDSQADAAGNATQASPLTDGFSVTTSGGGAINFYNASGSTYASWTFRKQPKFFDVVTYTGNGAATRAISHSLASTPGFVIIKETSTADNWHCWHRSFASFSTYIFLNSANGSTTTGGSTIFKGMSATDFTIGSDSGVNASGSTYVAYLFAHDAGGFGLTGTDNVISCGSFTTDGSGNATVSLGYEPQWLLIKSVTFGSWWITDTMRDMSVASGDNVKALFANTSGAEANANEARPNATGFTVGPSGNLSSSDTFIYIAIRRGPMKVPTSGTSVFSPAIWTGNDTARTITSNIVTDFAFIRGRNTGATGSAVADRLRGANNILQLESSSSSFTDTGTIRGFDLNNGIKIGGHSSVNWNTYNFVAECFKRAPGFFDMVTYEGTGSARNITHNLAVTPELIIVKLRTVSSAPWMVYSSSLGSTKLLNLNNDSPVDTNATVWGSMSSTTFGIGTNGNVNTASSSYTYIAYLFATAAGVSKVGSYTGTATTLQIDCGFTGGARFVMIKRTDSTGDWYFWDTTRGIIAGNDPYLFLNSNANEVTNTDYIDPYSPGFELSSTAPSALNASGGTYIFLAIA